MESLTKLSLVAQFLGLYEYGWKTHAAWDMGDFVRAFFGLIFSLRIILSFQHNSEN